MQQRFACTKLRLLNDLVGACEQRRGHVERQRPSSAGINHQLELRWQLNRQVARFFALENATCIYSQDPIGLVGIRSIAHQPPDGGKFTAEVEGRHRMPCRKHDDLGLALRITISRPISAAADRRSFS